MNAIAEVTDQATATASLNAVRNHLAQTIREAEFAMDKLRERIVSLRPSGLMSVDQMAQAIGRDRNYIDSVWSAFGDVTKGKQTRVAPVAEDDRAVDRAATELTNLAHQSKKTADLVIVARAERDRTVAMVYGSKLLGPSAIAANVGVDRNHVLRIARRQGIGPAHREVSRNQYSDGVLAAEKAAAARKALATVPFETTAE